MRDAIRILLFADSHLGLDLPVRPRADRRRRGHDFLANYHAALEPARTGDVDVVVHAGDVFDRPNVAPRVARLAYEPLRRVADLGVPVLIVPGNHERSRLPHPQLLAHPSVHVFDRPRTFVLNVDGTAIAFSGFPYERREVRTQFGALLARTGWQQADAKHRVLCVHHCIEGATVGPSDFMFTRAADVIRHADVPREFAALFTGHVHRHQALVGDLDGRPLATPVLYPGSIERTSFAEAAETKGFMLVTLGIDDGRVQWQFRQLPARPMIRVELRAGDDDPAFANAIRQAIETAPPDAVLSLRVHGELREAHWQMLSARALRSIAPATMNVDVVPVDQRAAMRRPRAVASPPIVQEQLAFDQLSFV